MKELVRKGQKSVVQYMKRAGYQFYDCTETDNGYVAEYYKTAAGITLKTVFVQFNKNMRVVAVTEQ